MRLWSISPSYLDRQGLCGLWREALLGQSCLIKGEYSICPDCNGKTYIFYDKELKTEKCLNCKGTGKIKTPYWNHPQLKRFKANKSLSLYWIIAYLYTILDEGLKRDYKFDKTKIRLARQTCVTMTVTKGQLVFEIHHLLKKLKIRDREKYIEVSNKVDWREGSTYLYYNENKIQAHPIFKIIEGNKEKWEKG